METKPLCPYFGECGGCSAQHIAYETQLENKKNVVINELKSNKIELPENIQVFSNEPYFYRNRMDFVFFNGGIGLRKKGFFDKIVEIKKCVISNNKINQLLEEVWQWYEESRQNIDVFNLRNSIGTLKYATIRCAENTDSTSISFILNEESTKLAEHIELIKKFAEKTSAKNVVIGRVPAKRDESVSSDCFAVKGDVFIEEIIDGKKIMFHSQSFFQNNTKMAEKMVNYCKQLLQNHDTKAATLIDLYGGAGTFGVCLGDLFNKVIITDIDENNVNLASENIRNNGLNGQAICADASKLKFNGKEIFMIVDPPRSGMHPKTIKQILALQPKSIIYVSCNPKQMAKELPKLAGYEVASVAVFDLFPQTLHVEAIAELRKK